MEKKYLPEQLKRSPEFIDDQDIINVVLDKDTLYSKSECEKAVSAFKDITDREVF